MGLYRGAKGQKTLNRIEHLLVEKIFLFSVQERGRIFVTVCGEFLLWVFCLVRLVFGWT